jgi:hypothetical protein
LIVESHWTDRTSGKVFIENIESNSTCLSGEDFRIISECHPCTAFELASQNIGVCTKARYKEILECKSGEKITRRYAFILYNYNSALVNFIAINIRFKNSMYNCF